MADDTPVTLPELDPSDVWGGTNNSAFRTIEGRINVLRQQLLALPDPSVIDDAALADVVADPVSATHAAVVAAGVQLGTGHTEAAFGDHGHAASAITSSTVGLSATTVQASLTELLSLVTALSALVAAGAGTVPTGFMVVRRAVAGVYPVRGTLPPGTVVFWVGPAQPSTGGSYAVSGTDWYFKTAA